MNLSQPVWTDNSAVWSSCKNWTVVPKPGSITITLIFLLRKSVQTTS